MARDTAAAARGVDISERRGGEFRKAVGISGPRGPDHLSGEKRLGHSGRAWISIESSGLGGYFPAGCLHRRHILYQAARTL
jgi:hypothetical protein